MDPSELYEHDFVAWTERQAAALRAITLSSNSLDLPNLAEEIESLGRRDVREVGSLIRQIMLHLLTLAGEPGSPSCRHWRAEVAGFQADASSAYTPSMAQKIEVDAIWQRALTIYEAEHSGDGFLRLQPSGSTSPISLDEFVGHEFAVEAMADRVAAQVISQAT